MSRTLNTQRGEPRAPASAYVLMTVTGIGAAALAGLITAWTNDARPLLSFVVVFICIVGPCLSMSWLVFVSDHTVVRDRNAEENVENRWMTSATSGACLDTAITVGISLVVIAVFHVEISGTVALLGVMVLILVDTTLRYIVAKRRES